MENILLASLFFLSSLSVNALQIYGNTEVDLYESESYVITHDSTILNVHSTADVGALYTMDSSTLNIYGGEVSWLYGLDNTTVNIHKGDIAWLLARDNNITNISFIADLGWLIVNDDSVVNIYGSSFSYFNGRLLGRWNNGSNFSFWAFEEASFGSGNLSSILPDNIILHTSSVPESSSLILMLVGMAYYFRRRAQYKK